MLNKILENITNEDVALNYFEVKGTIDVLKRIKHTPYPAYTAIKNLYEDLYQDLITAYRLMDAAEGMLQKGNKKSFTPSEVKQYNQYIDRAIVYLKKVLSYRDLKKYISWVSEIPDLQNTINELEYWCIRHSKIHPNRLKP